MAGGAIAALTATSLWGGLQRVLDTEDARVQMQRMGVSISEVDTLLAAVDDTFQGTPFANPDGFNISSQLFASGVELDNIPPILGDIADLAAHGNVPIDQMGQLFVRAAAQGKITGEELNRLTDMNIPLTQLADAMGLSVSELRDMASSGELTADKFFEGIAAVEMFEGAAKAAGDTTRGAFSNVRTALALLGEKLIGPLFGENGAAVQVLKSMREAIRSLIPAATSAGEAIAAWLIPAVQDAANWFQNTFIPALQRVGELLRQGQEWYQANAEQIDKIVAAVVPAIGALAGLATGVHLVTTALRLMALATPIGILLALVSALIYAWQNSEMFREIVTNAFNAVRDFVGPIIQTIIDWVRGFGEQNANTSSWIMETWEQIKGIFSSAGELIMAIIERVTSIITTVWSVFGENIKQSIQNAWEFIKSIVSAALDIIRGLITTVTGIIQGDWSKAWEGIKQVFSGVWDAIKAIFTLAWESIKNTLDAGLNAIQALWDRIWEAISNKVSSIWDSIKSTVSDAFNSVRDTISSVLDSIRSSWNSAWDTVSKKASSIWESIKSTVRNAINSARDTVSNVLSSIRSAWNNAWDTIRTKLTSTWDTIKSSVSNAINSAKTTINNVLATIKSLWSGAWDVMKSRLDSAWEGIKAAVRTAINAVMTTIRGLKDRILGVFSNAGTWLRDAGRRIIQGLINGIQNMAGNVRSAVSGVLERARNLLPFSPAKEGPFSGRGWTLYSGRSIMDALIKGLEDEERHALLATQKIARTLSQSLSGISADPSIQSLTMSSRSSALASSIERRASLANAAAGAAGSTYQFYGDIMLPNVTDPDSFFDELEQAARKRSR